jgi:hypothetical protein
LKPTLGRGQHAVFDNPITGVCFFSVQKNGVQATAIGFITDFDVKSLSGAHRHEITKRAKTLTVYWNTMFSKKYISVVEAAREGFGKREIFALTDGAHHV